MNVDVWLIGLRSLSVRL